MHYTTLLALFDFWEFSFLGFAHWVVLDDGFGLEFLKILFDLKFLPWTAERLLFIEIASNLGFKLLVQFVKVFENLCFWDFLIYLL